jgi:hypothetical protein
LQKAQARVHVSPMIIMVAWRCDQHSLRLGQPASSHTVVRPCWRTMLRVSATTGPADSLTRSHSGRGKRGVSGRAAFSGCREALLLRVSRTVTKLASSKKRASCLTRLEHGPYRGAYQG